MMLIPLTKGKFSQVSDHRYEELSKYRWHAVLAKGRWWYAVRTIRKENGKRGPLGMHQQILGRMWVDHKDGDGLNNQDENLRPSTQFQNQWNRPKSRNNSSGSKNVYLDKKVNRWYPRISVNGKRIRLGGYATFEEAQAAARAARKIHHGEFARE